jgi:cell division protein FtsL
MGRYASPKKNKYFSQREEGITKGEAADNLSIPKSTAKLYESEYRVQQKNTITPPKTITITKNIETNPKKNTTTPPETTTITKNIETNPKKNTTTPPETTTITKNIQTTPHTTHTPVHPISEHVSKFQPSVGNISLGFQPIESEGYKGFLSKTWEFLQTNWIICTVFALCFIVMIFFIIYIKRSIEQGQELVIQQLNQRLENDRRIIENLAKQVEETKTNSEDHIILLKKYNDLQHVVNRLENKIRDLEDGRDSSILET